MTTVRGDVNGSTRQGDAMTAVRLINDSLRYDVCGLTVWVALRSVALQDSITLPDNTTLGGTEIADGFRIHSQSVGPRPIDRAAVATEIPVNASLARAAA